MSTVHITDGSKGAGEAGSLQWQWVGTDRFTIPKTKNGRAHSFPLSAQARAALEARRPAAQATTTDWAGSSTFAAQRIWAREGPRHAPAVEAIKRSVRKNYATLARS